MGIRETMTEVKLRDQHFKACLFFSTSISPEIAPLQFTGSNFQESTILEPQLIVWVYYSFK